MKKATAVMLAMVLFLSCKKENYILKKENSFSKTSEPGIYFENILPGDTITKSGKRICVFSANFFVPFEDVTNTSSLLFQVSGNLSGYQFSELQIDGDNKGVSSWLENGNVFVNFRSKNPFYGGWHTLKIFARVSGNVNESFSVELVDVDFLDSNRNFRSVTYNNYHTGLITFK